jgi:hypothetical protein
MLRFHCVSLLTVCQGLSLSFSIPFEESLWMGASASDRMDAIDKREDLMVPGDGLQVAHKFI